MRTILSIDWDFFIEENPMLDLGHSEKQFYLETLWHFRAVSWLARGKTVEETMPFVGPSPADFFVYLYLKYGFNRNKLFDVAIGESHQSIVLWLDRLGWKKYDIINFDAHHDLGYNEKEEIDCGNWAFHLIKQNKLQNYTVIYPEWRTKFPENTAPMLSAITNINKNKSITISSFELKLEKIKKKKIDAIFMCRSGCWTPPIYDPLFTELTKLLCGDLEPLPARYWNKEELMKNAQTEKEILEKMAHTAPCK